MESLCVKDDALNGSEFWQRQAQHIGRPNLAVKVIEGSPLSSISEDTLDRQSATDSVLGSWDTWRHKFDFAPMNVGAIGPIEIHHFDHAPASFQLLGEDIAELVREVVVEALDRIWTQEFDLEGEARGLEEQLSEERALRERAEERLRRVEAAREVETDELGDLVVLGTPLERKPVTLRFLGKRQGMPLLAPEEITD